MLTFLHAADIHMDSPLRGLLAYEGAPPIEEIRGATRQALDNLVNFALEEKVNFVLVAGDLYDGDWQDFNTGLYFANQMRNLGESGIRVAVIRGNHDAANTNFQCTQAGNLATRGSGRCHPRPKLCKPGCIRESGSSLP
ncbi:MAG: metallophosphoesterase [Deltaproteobacteria bacterium]|nr:metallophosphoesterase [Deltaproteobacteria bacterium]